MKQAMIFAAGLGTRLKPLTDTMPKALVPVGGEPLLWHVVMKMKAAGFGRIVVNVHHFAQQIIDYLAANNNFGIDIRISNESQGLLDTGGGLRKASTLFDSQSPVLVHNVDILSNADLNGLYDSIFHRQLKDIDMTAALSMHHAVLLVSKRPSTRQLIFQNSMTGSLEGWTNLKTGEVWEWPQDVSIPRDNCYAFSGIHVVSPSLLQRMQSWTEKFSIIEYYVRHCDKSRIVKHEQPGLRLMDVGKLDTLDAAEDFLRTL